MSRPRVLVVDDEPGLLRAIERLLAGDYDVACCRTAALALEQAKTLAPEIALLDIRMPDVSGFDLMDRLQSACKDLYVILMTGSTSQLDANLIRTIRSKAFYFIQKPFERELLLTLVQRCVQQRRLWVENRQLVDRLTRELAEARTFQHSLLPPERADLAGVQISARYIPTAELAGDFYDYAAADDHRVSVLVADAAGHGVSAAMLTGVVKSAFDSAHVDDYEPLGVVRRIMSGIRDFDAHRFVTLTCARIDTRTRMLDYVNAGHPAGMLWGPQRDLTLLQSTGCILSSVFERPEWTQARIELRPADRLLLYTDGVIECEGRGGQFGRQRLIELVHQHSAGGAELLDAILARLGEFSSGVSGLDDLALLCAAIP